MKHPRRSDRRRWREVFNQLRLLFWLLALSGCLFAAAGGYLLVKATSQVRPWVYLLGGLGLIAIATYVARMTATARKQLQTKRDHK